MTAATPTSLEMATLPPTSIELEPIPNKGGLCGRTFKDWTQYPSTICGVTNGGLAVAFLIGAIVVTLLMESSTTKTGLMVAGYGLGIFFSLNSTVQCISCYRVKQLKPEKDLENQIGTLGTRNRELETENQKLIGTHAGLSKLLDQYKAERDVHEVIAANVQKTLDDRVAQLTALQQKFAENQHQLEKIQLAFDQFKLKTDEAQKEIIKLAEHSNELRKKLLELGIINKDFEKQDSVWDENYVQLSSGVDEFTKQNLQMANLQIELKKQVELMRQFLEFISAMAEKIRASTMRIDESDDKLLATSQHLESVIKEKARQDKILESLQHRYEEQKQVLGVLKETLLRVDENKGRFTNVIKLIDAAIQ